MTETRPIVTGEVLCEERPPRYRAWRVPFPDEDGAVEAMRAIGQVIHGRIGIEVEDGTFYIEVAHSEDGPGRRARSGWWIVAPQRGYFGPVETMSPVEFEGRFREVGTDA